MTTTPCEDTLWESRVMLTPRDPRSLMAIMGTKMRNSSTQFAHKMIWTLFPGMPDARRKDLFLFHVERNQPFTAIIRSRRPPEDGLGGVWTIERTRPFQPVLEPGQRLRFHLRAVASRWERRPGQARGHRVDAVRFAWNKLTAAERTPETLDAAAHAAAFHWLARQGDRCGFQVEPRDVSVLNYEHNGRDPWRRQRTDGDKEVAFGSLTYEGILTVAAADPFRRMLAEGVGAGRAYGNGLMQIAPVRYGMERC